MIHTLPKPSPAAVAWTAESAIARAESPFSFRGQTYDHGGKRHRVTIDLPTMTASEGREWQAFFRAINGMAGEFYIYPVSLADPQRGSLRGSPVVAGAGQTGQSLDVAGFIPNALAVLRAGDWLSIGDRLYSVTEHAATAATCMGRVPSTAGMFAAPPVDMAPLFDAGGMIDLDALATALAVE